MSPVVSATMRSGRANRHRAEIAELQHLVSVVLVIGFLGREAERRGGGQEIAHFLEGFHGPGIDTRAAPGLSEKGSEHEREQREKDSKRFPVHACHKIPRNGWLTDSRKLSHG